MHTPEQRPRLEQLTEAYLEVLHVACDRIPVEEYARLSRHTGQSQTHFEEQFREFLRGKAVRTVSQILGSMHLPQSLAKIDEAEHRAQRTYEKMGATGHLPPEEQPAHFETLGIQDLVDLKLLRARKEWNAELLRRIERVETEVAELEDDARLAEQELARMQRDIT